MSNRVLVLDVEKHIAVVIKSILSRLDYEVIWSRSLEEATNFLNHSQCSLVIADYRLPDGDGISWMTEMREQGHYIPFILLSGFSMNEENQKRLRNLLGVKFILEKPVDRALFPDYVSIAITQPKDEIEAIYLNEIRAKQGDEQCDKFKELNSLTEDDLENFDPFETYTDSEPIVETLNTSVSSDKEKNKEFSLVTFLEDATTSDKNDGLGEFQDILDQRLVELKIDYLKEVPGILEELARNIESALEESQDEKALLEAMTSCHNLSSTSSGQSFMAIEEIAEQIASCLRALKEKRDKERVLTGADLESGLSQTQNT